jgi:hypothetical protein
MTATTTLILGGGFGGISAANSLRRLLPSEHGVVVIDKFSHFHVGAGNTWIMLGKRTREQISQSRTALLAPGVRFVEASILGLDLSTRSVSMEKETLHWDYLVIALGADLDLAKVPGLAEAAHTFSLRTRSRPRSCPERRAKPSTARGTVTSRPGGGTRRQGRRLLLRAAPPRDGEAVGRRGAVPRQAGLGWTSPPPDPLTAADPTTACSERANARG